MISSVPLRSSRRIPAGDEASYRVFDHNGAVEEVRELTDQLRHGVLAATCALEKGPRCPVRVPQESFSLDVPREQREKLAQRYARRDDEEPQTQLLGVSYHLYRRLVLRAPEDCGSAALGNGGEEARVELFATGHGDLVRAEPALRLLVHCHAFDRATGFPWRQSSALELLDQDVEQLFEDHPSPNAILLSVRTKPDLIYTTGGRMVKFRE